MKNSKINLITLLIEFWWIRSANDIISTPIYVGGVYNFGSVGYEDCTNSCGIIPNCII